MAASAPGNGASQAGGGPQGPPTLHARAAVATSQPPCMPFQSPPRVAHRNISFAHAAVGGGDNTEGTGDALPEFLVEQQAGGHVVMRAGVVAAAPAAGARLTFFDRIDALKELRALREAEVLETHTLAHAILEWGAETNYTVTRNVRSVSALLTTNPMHHKSVQNAVAAIKSTIESLRALLRGEWTFEEVVFTDEQLAEFRRQGRFGFDRTRGAGDEGVRRGMSAEQEEPEAPTEGSAVTTLTKIQWLERQLGELKAAMATATPEGGDSDHAPTAATTFTSSVTTAAVAPEAHTGTCRSPTGPPTAAVVPPPQPSQVPAASAAISALAGLMRQQAAADTPADAAKAPSETPATAVPVPQATGAPAGAGEPMTPRRPSSRPDMVAILKASAGLKLKPASARKPRARRGGTDAADAAEAKSAGAMSLKEALAHKFRRVNRTRTHSDTDSDSDSDAEGAGRRAAVMLRAVPVPTEDGPAVAPSAPAPSAPVPARGGRAALLAGIQGFQKSKLKRRAGGKGSSSSSKKQRKDEKDSSKSAAAKVKPAPMSLLASIQAFSKDKLKKVAPSSASGETTTPPKQAAKPARGLLAEITAVKLRKTPGKSKRRDSTASQARKHKRRVSGGASRRRRSSSGSGGKENETANADR